MATLLTMVNDLRIMLREEQVTIISATDDRTQALIPLINRATKSVLESRTWSFDKRHDGVATYRGLVTGTDVACILENPVYIEYSLTALSFFSSNTLAVRFRVTDDTVKPGLSYRVNSAIVVGVTFGLAVTPVWSGETPINSSTSSWELYATDVMLPSTVRRVLSVRDEEQPVQLYFSEDEIFKDRQVPRLSDETGDAKAVVVGGTMTTTTQTGVHAAPEKGMRMRVYPVPESDTFLYYSYVYSHPEMTAAADTLVGVPDRIISLIVDKAFYYCLASNIEADPVRAPQVMKQYRIDLELAGREDRVTPNRRGIMRPVGAHPGRHPNSRWNDREVPSP